MASVGRAEVSEVLPEVVIEDSECLMNNYGGGRKERSNKSSWDRNSCFLCMIVNEPVIKTRNLSGLSDGACQHGIY